jgi:hypothetical protein
MIIVGGLGAKVAAAQHHGLDGSPPPSAPRLNRTPLYVVLEECIRLDVGKSEDHGIKMQIVILERGVGHARNEARRHGDVVPNVVKPAANSVRIRRRRWPRLWLLA